MIEEKTKKGNRVVLGDYIHILEGITIGDNAIIDANWVVIRSVPHDLIAAGAQVKMIRVVP